MTKLHFLLASSIFFAMAPTGLVAKENAPNRRARINAVTTDPTKSYLEINRLAEIKARQIASDCHSSDASACLKHFERYYRGNQDHRKKGGLLGIFGGEHFWGAAEELHYTQIDYNYDGKLYEFQVGYGYQIAARQAKATMQGTGTGLVASLPPTISGNTGGTRYWAMLIGIAPDKLTRKKENEDPKPASNCDSSDELKPESGLVCAIDMQPAVTDAYYRENASRLALAMDRWRRNFSLNNKRLRTVCPQVINFREKYQPATPISYASKGLINSIVVLNDILSATCGNKRPNLKIVYRDQDATASWEGTGNSNVETSITQEYDRFRVYFTRTARSQRYFEDLIDRVSDHRFTIKMEGTNRNAKLPSILSSIVTYEQSDVSHHLTVKVYCSGGATATAVADNPVANAIAYTQVVEKARNAVDANGSECPSYANKD